MGPMNKRKILVPDGGEKREENARVCSQQNFTAFIASYWQRGPFCVFELIKIFCPWDLCGKMTVFSSTDFVTPSQRLLTDIFELGLGEGRLESENGHQKLIFWIRVLHTVSNNQSCPNAQKRRKQFGSLKLRRAKLSRVLCIVHSECIIIGRVVLPSNFMQVLLFTANKGLLFFVTA